MLDLLSAYAEQIAELQQDRFRLRRPQEQEVIDGKVDLPGGVRGGSVCLDRNLTGSSGALRILGHPRRRSPSPAQGKSVRHGG